MSPRSDELTPEQRLLLYIYYEGPFGRLASWLWKVPRAKMHDGDDLPLSVPDGSLRDRLAVMCDQLDAWWREWHLRRNTMPSERWAR